MRRSIIKHLNLYLISILTLFIISCKSEKLERSIIWTDLRNKRTSGTIVLSFIGIQNEKKINITEKLKINSTKSLRLPEMCYCIGEKHSFDIVIDYYPKYSLVTRDTDSFEIFLYDKADVVEKNTCFEVKKKDNVEAYYVEYCDKETDRNYLIISTDNILKKVPIEYKPESLKKIMDDILIEDIAYYDSTESISSPHLIPFNGYIVKNKVDGTYVWLSTYTFF